MEQEQDYDAVGEFVCDARNDAYNRAFLHWRKTGPPDYAFRFVRRGRERVFVDGAGFLNAQPATAMRGILSHVSRVIGFALMLILICEVGGGGVLVRVFQKLGLDVQLSMLSMDMYGSQWGIVLIKMAVCLLKYLIPALVLLWKFQLPSRIVMPGRISGSAEALFGASAALLCGVGVNVMGEWTGDSELSRQLFFNYKDVGAVLTYALFDIFVVSMLAELFSRGILLTVLRQFGDWFAIIVVAVAAFLMPNELSLRLGEFAIGIISGYCFLRTGSIFTCFFIRIVYSAGNFAQLLRTTPLLSAFSATQFRLLFVSFALLGMTVSALIRSRETKKFRPFNRVAVLRPTEKIEAMVATTTLLPVFAVSVILTLIQLAL